MKNKLLLALSITLAATYGCDQETSEEGKGEKGDSNFQPDAMESDNTSQQGKADIDFGDFKASPKGDEGFTGYYESMDRERYDEIEENKFLSAAAAPLSTFSIDVDTASYTNMRDMINYGQRPPVNAVRIEEMINYFEYSYPQPTDEHPFSVTMDMGSAPWQGEHRLLKIGLKGKDIALEDRPAANLVFLIDVSGSMGDNIELVKKGLSVLAETVASDDRVAIVVYAGSSGLVLEPTSDRAKIKAALDALRAGGSTNGAAGINLAYEVAEANKIENGINRVILATDGDFNVGVSSDDELVELVTSKAEGGVELSVLGFGRGNYNDSMMEKISNHGNGNYYYIDSIREAEKVLGGQVMGTLLTIAKDVKIQIEFNPAKVAAYRLIGYENRILNAQDFNDDKKDAGEIGAGHTVTALYEIIPATGAEDIAGKTVDTDKIDPLVYLDAEGLTERATTSNESVVVKLRYKQPQSDTSTLMTYATKDAGKDFVDQNQDFKFCAAVAGFGMIVRNSPHKGTTTSANVVEWANAGKGADLRGYREEFIQLVGKFQAL